MKIILAILAICGFCLEALSTLYALVEFSGGMEGSELIGHYAMNAGYLAGSAAGICVAIACCLSTLGASAPAIE